MVPFTHSKHSFLLEFFYKGELPGFYADALNTLQNSKAWYKHSKIVSYPENEIVIVEGIPPYLQLQKAQSPIKYGCFAIKRNEGFWIDLRPFQNLQDYLAQQFSRNGRSQLKRSLKRLEACFNVSYRVYFGQIEQSTFEKLFVRLEEMIRKRFAEKKATHSALKNWEEIRNTGYHLILNKRASLFVIYDGQKPIDICFNYHQEHVMNNALRSFDTDYSKFRLGYIDIYRQLEWSFSNGIALFDLSRGGLRYKKQWCNHQYVFETQILYPSNRFFQKWKALLVAKWFTLKEYLKSSTLRRILVKLRSLFGKKPQLAVTIHQTRFEFFLYPELPPEVVQINLESEKYEFLRRSIYEFQYAHSIPSKKIELYSRPKETSWFIKARENYYQLLPLKQAKT